MNKHDVKKLLGCFPGSNTYVCMKRTGEEWEYDCLVDSHRDAAWWFEKQQGHARVWRVVADQHNLNIEFSK